MQANYGPGGGWLDPESRHDADRVLSYFLRSRRTPHEWSEIDAVFDRLSSALASGDVRAVRAATAELERMTVHRADPIDPGKDTPPGPPSRDRMVHLQRRLDADLDQFRATEQPTKDDRRT